MSIDLEEKLIFSTVGLMIVTLVVFLGVLFYQDCKWPEYRDSHHCLPIAQSGIAQIPAGKVIVEHSYIVWQCDGGEIVER